MTNFSTLVATFLILLFSVSSVAQIPELNTAPVFEQEEPEFLPVDDAFAFDFQQNGDELLISFDIADAYYLYKHQFKLVGKGVTLGEPTFR